MAALGALVLARSFLMPVIMAWLLALTFSPVRRWLGRRGIPAGIVALLVVFGLIAGLCVAAIGLSAPIRQYSEDAPRIIAEAERKLRGLSSAIEKVAQASEQVEKIAQGPDGTEPERVVVQGPGTLATIATNTPFVLTQLTLTMALLFFLIASGDIFYEKIVAASPTFRDKRRSLQIAHDIERKISRYFLTITVINAGLGLAVGAAMYVLGMPNPALFGVLAFVLNFVPYLGALLGALICAAIGLVSYDTAGPALLAAAVYLGLTSVEGQFITPFAVGRSLKLNPVVVFLAVAFWGWAWSAIGMIIAVPVLIAIRAFGDHVPSMRGLGLFLADRQPVAETRTDASVTSS
jgi:predicted PurR-regulated permease PerM